MPRGDNQENQGELLQIVSPDKKVGGYTWEQYHQKLAQNGWVDAEKDNFLRGLFNLAQESEQRPDPENEQENARQDQQLDQITKWAHHFLTTDKYKNEQGREKSRDNIRDAVTMEVLLPTSERQEPKIPFQEDQRKTVLFFQKVVKDELQREFDFDEAYPAREEMQVQNGGRNEAHNEAHNEVEENLFQLEDPNLIPILDPNKKIGKYNWEQLCQKLDEVGWFDPANDNSVRAAFNLSEAGEAPQGIGETLLWYAGGNVNVDYQRMDPHHEALRHAIRDEFILKAKNDKNFTMEEDKRRSVLFFQNLLNLLDNEKFDFDSYYPAPGMQVNEDQEQPNENPDVNLDENLNFQEGLEQQNANLNANLNVQENLEPQDENLQANENENLNNQENPEQNIQAEAAQENAPRQNAPRQNAPQPTKLRRKLKDNENLKTDAGFAADLLESSTLWLRGSSEYKNAREEFKRVQQRWQKAVDNPEGKVSEEELLSLRGDLLNVMYLADRYLDKKYRQKDESKNARDRKSAMEYAFDVIEDQLAILDARRDELRNSPAPELETLTARSKAAMESMRKAELRLRGSDEFDEAEKAFKTIDKKFAEWEKKYAGKEDQITSDELDEVRGLLMNADDLLLRYTSMKSGDTISETTHARTHAMQNGRTVIGAALRKLDELDAAKREKMQRSGIRYDQTAQTARDAIQEAERNVHLGSSEYKNAKEAYQKYTDMITELWARDRKLTERELEDLTQRMDAAQKQIDIYLEGKREKELSSKTQKRVDAMRQAKESILELRYATENLQKLYREEAMLKNVDELEKTENEVRAEVDWAKTRVDGSKVYFGGKDYDKAQELYSNVVKREAVTRAAGHGEPSRNALMEEIKELQEAKEAALVYIRRKEQEKAESKKHKLDAKGEKRLEVMSKAYDNIRTRLDIAEGKLNAITEKERADRDAKIDALVEEKRMTIPTGLAADRMEKVIAIETSSAVNTIAMMSKQKSLTEIDQRSLKCATAELMLAQMIEEGTIKKPIRPTLTSFDNYADSIANSKEFQEAFPKDKLDPEFCKKLLTDKRVLKGTARKFTQEIQKAQEQKMREKQKTKNKDMETSKEAQKGKSINKG